jgi:hypothetical protein
MAIAMTIGSYVAGSTPMGGGTVGFPVLFLLAFHEMYRHGYRLARRKQVCPKKSNLKTSITGKST